MNRMYFKSSSIANQLAIEPILIAPVDFNQSWVTANIYQMGIDSSPAVLSVELIF